MALGVYSETSPSVFTLHSSNGAFTNPVTSLHHGRNGQTAISKLYLRTDATVVTYTNIQVQAVSTGDDIGIGNERGSSGWGVKLLLDTGSDPNELHWAAVEYGFAIDANDMDPSESQAFWLRIESPAGIDVDNKTDIKLQLLYTMV